MLPSRKELIGFTLLFVTFFGFAFVNKSTFDTGDSINHYLISRYSWQHPALFFNHWGKPLFTIISSPFSQFGFIGIQFFNILVSVLSGYYVYKSGKKLGYTISYFPLVLLFTATDYFLCMYSGLTEPLFGLVLIMSFYLVLEGKFFTAALVLSFLPFIRSEGNIILIVFAVYFIFIKKYFHVLLLSVGTIIISIAGYPIYKTVTWVFTSNPYTTKFDNYGKGELLHYVKQFPFVAGLFYTVILVIGVIYFLNKNLKIDSKGIANYNREIILLAFGSFFAYFISHSIFWWQGLFHSYGMTRVLVAILPIGSILCLGPIDALLKKWPNKYILPVLSISMIGFSFSGNKSGFNLQKDFSLSPTLALAIEMNDWYKLNYPTSSLIIAAPHLAYIMNKDCFDHKQCTDMLILKNEFPKEKLIIWDNWIAVMEFGITDKELDSMKKLRLIKIFGNGNDTLKVYGSNEEFEIKN